MGKDKENLLLKLNTKVRTIESRETFLCFHIKCQYIVSLIRWSVY